MYLPSTICNTISAVVFTAILGAAPHLWSAAITNSSQGGATTAAYQQRGPVCGRSCYHDGHFCQFLFWQLLYLSSFPTSMCWKNAWFSTVSVLDERVTRPSCLIKCNLLFTDMILFEPNQPATTICAIPTKFFNMGWSHDGPRPQDVGLYTGCCWPVVLFHGLLDELRVCYFLHLCLSHSNKPSL